MNGHQHNEFTLGLLLGGLRSESERQTEIMLSHFDETRRLREDLRDLPERLAGHLQDRPARRADFDSWLNILKAAGAVAILAGVVAGKVAQSDALPLIRSILGGP